MTRVFDRKMSKEYITEIEKAYGDDRDEALMQKAGEIIKNGGLVAIPTETVYGLAGNALDPESSKKIYAAKGRPSDNPLIVHIAEFEALAPIVRDIPERAERLASKYWPGPLTMIFNKSDKVPKETTGGLDTVAVRMPVNKTALSFIRASGGYIAAPSANSSGRPSCTTAAHVYEDLKGKIPLIIDGGDVGIGLESTIVDMTGDLPVLLRPGYISHSQLEEILGRVLIDPNVNGSELKEEIRPKAPGMKYKHYAPKGQLYIVKGSEEECTERINSECRDHKDRGESSAVICLDTEVEKYTADVVSSLGTTYEDAAHNLFKCLRQMDEKNIEYMYIRSFDSEGLGMAIMNRLIRAAGHKIIEV